MTPQPVSILGAGMHPWAKWGNDFTEYGMVAARAALAESGLDWRQIQFVAGADTIRNGYPGFVAGATFAQKLGWTGVPVSSSYAACPSGSQALQSARANILAGFCDVALVVDADTTPKGFFAPVGGERRNDPDWQRFHLIGSPPLGPARGRPLRVLVLRRPRPPQRARALRPYPSRGRNHPARPRPGGRRARRRGLVATPSRPPVRPSLPRPRPTIVCCSHRSTPTARHGRGSWSAPT